MNKEKVAIIGGGYTGLALAYFLSQKDYEVEIFERGENFGGLAGGFKIHGENLEKAYHHLFRSDTDIIDFVKEIGLEDKLRWLPSSVSIYYEGKLYPFNGVADLLNFSAINFVSRIRVGLVLLFLQKFKNWRTLAKSTAYEWMKKYSGSQGFKVIWEPLLKGKFSKYYDKVSMAWLWARVHIRANSRKLFSKEMLGYFDGGFEILTQKMVEKLNGLGVKLNANTNIEFVEKKGQVFEVSVNGAIQTFDKVILTTPSHIAARLIKNTSEELEAYKIKLNSINYIGAVLMIFSSEQDLSKYYWHNINDLNMPFLVFINHTKLAGTEKYQGKNVYYIGTYVPHEHEYFEIEEGNLTTLWFDALKKIFPEFNEKEILEKHIFKFKNAQHIVDTDYEEKIPDYETPIPGLYLSNFSQIYPEDRGTNYAIREAKKIAKLF